jgi:hypothetical protein
MLQQWTNDNQGINNDIKSSKLDSRVWILEHFSPLRIKYKKLKCEAYRMMNARKQQIMMRDLRLMIHELGFWKL